MNNANDASAENARPGPLAWAARNPVFANLVMGILLVGGLLFAQEIQQTVFPDIELNQVTITVPYPGASPEEVEQGVILALEEAVRGIEGVERIRSTAADGQGAVIAELFTGADRERARTDIDSAVARITSFPSEVEDPVVQIPDTRAQVISIILSGPLEPGPLRQLAERMREELLQKPDITLVEVNGLPPPEISIEVAQENLRRYGLTLPQIAQRVSQGSLDQPAGRLETPAGHLLLRVTEQRDRVDEFAALSVISLPDGSEVKLGDIAQVQEDYQTEERQAFFNGEPAVRLDVFRVGKQTPIEVSEAVHQYVEQKRQAVPPRVELTTWDDSAEIYADRLGLLVKNGAIGLGLVLLILGLFLMPRLAFWVALGMGVSFVGAFMFMPVLDVSLNMISLFAFLLALGIVVDDAIVVGEATYKCRSEGLSPLDAAIAGTREVATPVTFAVATTVIAFTPMLFVPGVAGDFFRNIPLIVIPILLLSLFESFFVLPAHLGHQRPRPPGRISRWQQRFATRLENFAKHHYGPFVQRAIEWRYLTLAAGLAILILVVALIASGRVLFSFFPDIEGDLVTASIEFPAGTSAAETRAAIERTIAAARALNEDAGDVAKGIYAELGRAAMANPMEAATLEGGSHLAYVQVALIEAGERELGSSAFADRWRERVGDIPGVQQLTFAQDIGPGTGAAIAVELAHPELPALRQAATQLADRLATYDGVFDVDDGFQQGKQQLDLELAQAGRSLGLTAQDLASQVRAAFFGAEAERQQRGREELRIYVRRPEAERATEYSVENMLIQLPTGGEIPLQQAAQVRRTESATRIERTDGERTVTVTADVDPAVTSANRVMADVQAQILPELAQAVPGLDHRLAGELQEQEDALGSLARGMALALFAMYALMAVAFRSYVEPFLVIFSIPFGVVGAVIGHMVMGYNISLVSLLGLVALAGVVVNDALVYIAAVDHYRRSGMSVNDAIIQGGLRRFRPILLTSLTTFFGLAPMIFETSLQARFLIPMALSLGFGVLFVTLIVLILTPATYRILEDAREGIRRLKDRSSPEEPPAAPHPKTQHRAP